MRSIRVLQYERASAGYDRIDAEGEVEVISTYLVGATVVVIVFNPAAMSLQWCGFVVELMDSSHIVAPEKMNFTFVVLN